MNKIFIAVLCVLVLAGIGPYAFKMQKPQGPVACTLEAKLCPDGSAVGRTGPNCEFAPCPPLTTTGTVLGTMTIDPICPVEREGEPCLPTAEHFAARKVLVFKEDRATLVVTLTPNASGTFAAELPAGTYYLRMQRDELGGTSGLPTLITVRAGATSTLTVDVDTGIR